MKNLFIRESAKPTSLLKNTQYNTFWVATDFLDREVKRGVEKLQYQNIYITSDEEIKKGDWCLWLSQNKPIKSEDNSLRDRQDMVKKIILTTDIKLIKDGVQAIDVEFLDWFVYKTNDSGVPIDIVEVKKIYISLGKEDIFDLVCTACPSKYEIIIPNTDGWLSPMQKFRLREEPNQTDWKESTKALMEAYGDKPEEFPYEKSETNLEKHLASVPEYKGERRSAFISRQVTLEEVAEKLHPISMLYDHHSKYRDMYDCNLERRNAFIEGAKWQSTSMYSEEDVREIWKAGQKYWETSGDSITFEELIEKLKKKKV